MHLHSNDIRWPIAITDYVGEMADLLPLKITQPIGRLNSSGCMALTHAL